MLQRLIAQNLSTKHVEKQAESLSQEALPDTTAMAALFEGPSSRIEPLQPSKMYLRTQALPPLHASYRDMWDHIKVPYSERYWPERWPAILKVLAAEAVHAFRLTGGAATELEAKLLAHMSDAAKQERVIQKMQNYDYHLCGKSLGFMAPERAREHTTEAFHQVLLLETENFARAYV